MVMRLGANLLQFPRSIESCDEGRKFLVAESCENGMFVRLSTTYGHKLKNYWQAWVREVLLKLPTKYHIEIRISGDRVYVTSPVSIEKWFGAANHLLATLVPLPDIPMFRRYTQYQDVQWGVCDDADLTEVIKNIHLPDEVKRHYRLHGGDCDVYLGLRGTSKKRDRLFTPSEVAQMVELQVALACRNGYPKAERWPVFLDERRYTIPRVNLVKSYTPNPRYL